MDAPSVTFKRHSVNKGDQLIHDQENLFNNSISNIDDQSRYSQVQYSNNQNQIVPVVPSNVETDDRLITTNHAPVNQSKTAVGQGLSLLKINSSKTR